MQQHVKDSIIDYFNGMDDESPMQPAIDMMQAAIGRDFTEAEYTTVFIIIGDVDNEGDYTPLWDYLDVLSMWDATSEV